MTKPEFYKQSSKKNIAELSSQLADIDAKLAAVEDAWLQHQEELEQFTQ